MQPSICPPFSFLNPTCFVCVFFLYFLKNSLGFISSVWSFQEMHFISPPQKIGQNIYIFFLNTKNQKKYSMLLSKMMGYFDF